MRITRQKISLNFYHIILVVILAAIGRKLWIGHIAMDYVNKCVGQVGKNILIADPNLRFILNSMISKEPILVTFLNQYALNMTLNWLCNTHKIEGVHSRLLLVTMDRSSDQKLAHFWPGINRLFLEIPCLSLPFNYGDGPYQTFSLLRANFARVLIELDKSFWMIQQDTFWHFDLPSFSLEHQKENADITFDRAGRSDHGRLIAGGYFFVRPTEGSKLFFEQLAETLKYRFAPDNVLMTRICSTDLRINCAFIPFTTIANWMWFHDGGTYGNDKIPALIQFDGDTKNGGKLSRMRSLGFYFLNNDDGQSCDQIAVKNAKFIVQSIAKGTNLKEPFEICWHISYSHWQFAFYQALLNLLYKFRTTEWFLNYAVYPYGHYWMITI